MAEGDPINFDFTPEPPKAEGADAGAGAGADDERGAAEAIETEATAAANDGDARRAASGADAMAAPLPPVPDFRARDYPFASTSRFQQQAFEAARPARASHRRRLAWGVMAAVGAMLFGGALVVILKAVDQFAR